MSDAPNEIATIIPTVVAIIASITDLDIFLNLNTKVPLLGLELSISNFYTFAPLVLVLFHINVLYNTHQHFDKLNRLSHKIHNDNIFPYIVNFAFLNGWLVKVFTFLLLIGFSNLALWYMFSSFLLLKIDSIFYWHLSLIVIDFIAILFIFKKHYISYFSIVLFLFSTLFIGFSPLNYHLKLQNIRDISYKNISLEDLTSMEMARFQGKSLDFLKNDFTKSYILASTITHSDFQFSEMYDTEIEENNMSHNSYYRVNFAHSKIKDTDFSHSRFENINFSSASLKNVNFCDSTFINIIRDEGTNLEDVKCEENIKSVWKYKKTTSI